MIGFPEDRPFQIGRRIIHHNLTLLDFVKQSTHGGKMTIGIPDLIQL
jgi:hypothetical protein